MASISGHAGGKQCSAGAMGLVLALLLSLALPPVPADAAQRHDVNVYTGIAYTDPVPAETQGNLLDLYVPEAPGRQGLPLIIWSSGSAWSRDDGRAGAEEIAEDFNQQGYAVAGVSVRSSSQVRFPGQLHDLRAAIRWLRDHAGVYGLDPARFAIMGTSSGGWLAAIAATTSDIPRLPGESGGQGVSSSVQASVPFFPPTDFQQMNEESSTIDHDAPDSPESELVGCPIQTCPESTQMANPITYVDADDPSMLIIHGTDDPLVPHGQSALLFDALVEAGREAGRHVGTRLTAFISVAGAGHSLSEPSDVGDPVLGGDEFTVYRTNRDGRKSIVPTPAPNWEDIERFIDVALSRAGQVDGGRRITRVSGPAGSSPSRPR